MNEFLLLLLICTGIWVNALLLFGILLMVSSMDDKLGDIYKGFGAFIRVYTTIQAKRWFKDKGML